MNLFGTRFLQTVFLVDTIRTLALNTSPSFRRITDLRFYHHLRSERTHVIALRPLVLLVKSLVGRLVTTGGYVSMRRGMLEPILVGVRMAVARLVMRGVF